jgi:hypothetical protein
VVPGRAADSRLVDGAASSGAHGAEGVVRRIAILAADLFTCGLMVGGVVFIIGVALGIFQDGPVP